MAKQSIQNIIALSQLVREEISHADENKIATNSELAELMGCSPGSVVKYLKQGGLSEEEIDKRRHVILSQTASRTISNGRGIAKQTTEERRAIGDNNYRNGKGIASLTEEQRREIGTRNAEMHMTVFYNGNYFHSASEAAVAGIFEKHINGWKAERKKTWQINGNSLAVGAIDFLVNGSFVEYHPPKTYFGNGDFENHGEYKKFKEIKNKIREKNGRERADVFQRRVEGIIIKKYTESRRNAIENSDYKGTPLIYCADTDDVYDRVVAVYSQNPPEKKCFLKEFNSLLRKIKRENKAEGVKQ